MSALTVAEVRRRIARLRRMAGDDEGVADGAPDPAKLARAALKTETIEFSRWCA